VTVEARPGYRLVRLTQEHATDALRVFNEHVAGRFAAEDADGGFLGFGLLRPYAQSPVFSRAAVSTVFLAADRTGRGVGTAILRRMLEEARKMGITRVLAHVSSRNPRSIAFHRKHGFVECGRFPDVGRKWAKDFDVVWMIKSLERPDGA
jgi:L-amino acid N-acyltransferase YncA